MRALVVAGVVAGMAMATRAAAEPLPRYSIGAVGGGISGTGSDATSLGFGWLGGAQAALQPIATERRYGWSMKWSVVWGRMYGGEAARITDPLYLLQMDLLAGIRFRPGDNPSRYLTLRAGGTLLRTNQLIPPNMQRAFAGGVATIGFDQYVSSAAVLINVDVRFGVIGEGPATIGLMFGFSKTGS